MAKELFGCSFQELSAIDRNIHTCDNATQDWDRPACDIISEIQAQDVNSSDNEEPEEEDSAVDTSPIYSLCEMEDVIRKGKEFALAHGNSSLLISLITSEESLMDMRMDTQTSHQKKITDFF